MILSLLSGKSGIMDNIAELDLKYQFAMLASHVEDFLKEAFDTWDEGVYHIRDKQLDPMRKRLHAIRSIQQRTDADAE